MSDKLNIEEVDVPVEFTKHGLASRYATDILIQAGISAGLMTAASLASGSDSKDVTRGIVGSAIGGAVCAGVVYAMTRAECDLATGKEAKTVTVSSSDIKASRTRAIVLGTSVGVIGAAIKIASNLRNSD